MSRAKIVSRNPEKQNHVAYDAEIDFHTSDGLKSRVGVIYEGENKAVLYPSGDKLHAIVSIYLLLTYAAMDEFEDFPEDWELEVDEYPPEVKRTSI